MNVASIDQLVHDGIVDEIVQRVKTGKEAEVFVVRKGADYLAAKVYKERTQRNFKNNIGYMEGRAVRSSRDMRAMQKRTKYGVDKAETEWMHAEHDALVTVSHAGVRVPKAELFYEGVLLMELVLGADGQPAPRLIDVPMTAEEATAHHHDVISMVVKMLCCDLIHGDLSPYNILVAWNGCTIIDLPQVVKAAHNSQAEKFLVRDVRNVTEHFARYAPALKKRIHDGHQIWRKYMKRELAPDFFPEEGQSFAPEREFTPGSQRPNRPARPDNRPPREQRPPRQGQQGNPPPRRDTRPANASPQPSNGRPQPASSNHAPRRDHAPAKGPAVTHRSSPRPHASGPSSGAPSGASRPQGHHHRPKPR